MIDNTVVKVQVPAVLITSTLCNFSFYCAIAKIKWQTESHLGKKKDSYKGGRMNTSILFVKFQYKCYLCENCLTLCVLLIPNTTIFYFNIQYYIYLYI